jgi:hypothetical protein
MYMHSTEVLLSAAFGAEVCSEIAMGELSFTFTFFLFRSMETMGFHTSHLKLDIMVWRVGRGGDGVQA